MSKTAFKYEGTVSHGTMVPEHLLRQLLPVLAKLNPRAARKIEADFEDTIDHIGSDHEDAAECESELVEALFDALNAEAPEGFYFGSNPGDGSDYGFWAIEDADSFGM